MKRIVTNRRSIYLPSINYISIAYQLSINMYQSSISIYHLSSIIYFYCPYSSMNCLSSIHLCHLSIHLSIYLPCTSTISLSVCGLGWAEEFGYTHFGLEKCFSLILLFLFIIVRDLSSWYTVLHDNSTLS